MRCRCQTHHRGRAHLGVEHVHGDLACSPVVGSYTTRSYRARCAIIPCVVSLGIVIPGLVTPCIVTPCVVIRGVINKGLCHGSTACYDTVQRGMDCAFLTDYFLLAMWLAAASYSCISDRQFPQARFLYRYITRQAGGRLR